MFKVIVAGTRTFKGYQTLKSALDSLLAKRLEADEVVIISGHAAGADQMGERYAQERNLKCEIFPADWAQHGKAAGPIRNNQMAAVADALVAFWDGQSRGTQHMINTMYKLGKIVKIVRIR